MHTAALPGDHLMAGDSFFQVHPDDWHEIRGHLKGSEWLESMARTDVRWMLDQVYLRELKGGRFGLAKMPSANALKDVWGWTHWRARKFLKNEVPAEHARRTQTARGPHAVRIDSASIPHAVRTTEDGPTPDTQENPHASRIDSASIPHAVRIDSARKPPHARRDRLQTTDPTLQTADEAEVSAPPADPGKQLGLPAVTGPTPGKPAALPTKQQLSGEIQKTTFGPADKRRAAQRIYDAYRVHHPDEPGTPLGSGKGQIAARLTELARASKGKRPRYEPSDWTAAERDLIDLIEWYHVAPRSQWWRDNDNLGVGTLFRSKNFGDRIRDLNTWRSNGRSTEPPKAARRGANAHDFNDLSDLDDPPRDWIEGEIIDRNSIQGGHRGH